MAVATSTIFGILAVAGTAASVAQQRKSGRAQAKSQRIQQRKADIQAAQGRREAVRQARIRRADILATSANTGAGGSSAEQGVIGALQSQLGTSLGASFQNQALSGQQSSANIAASRASGQAATFGTIGDLSASFIKPTP